MSLLGLLLAVSIVSTAHPVGLGARHASPSAAAPKGNAVAAPKGNAVAMNAARPASRAASARAGRSRRLAPSRDVRARARALHLTVKWLELYPSRLWAGLELPGPCVRQAAGRRSCPISIDLRAWTAGELATWHCDARAIVPPPGSPARAHRTSADCTQLSA